uniref:Histone RNA hairpin-binding protein RNA-binding domain-containing protein n=1 Tax=Acrobeloides nanus TaxID=290746 RepID=A0A914EN03_9BILA
MMTSVDANGTTTSKTISLSQSAIDDLLSLGLGMPSEPVQQQQHQSTSLLDNPRGGHASDSWTPAGATTSDTSSLRGNPYLPKGNILFARRSKEIAKTKEKPVYTRYCNILPKIDRVKGIHPATPNKYTNCSRRSWDMQMRIWKKSLYLWAGDEPMEEHSIV